MEVVNAISWHYESANELQDDEWEEEEEAAAAEVLDDIGIWKAMDTWLNGALHFELLIGWLDSQHKTYVKISYWEEQYQN